MCCHILARGRRCRHAALLKEGRGNTPILGLEGGTKPLLDAAKSYPKVESLAESSTCSGCAGIGSAARYLRLRDHHPVV